MAPDVPPFDTQQEAARLGDAGFHQEQADAIVGTVRRAVANLVTKKDLDEAVAGLRTGLEGDINRQTTALKDEVREALAENGRQMTALKDEVRGALAENGRQMTALKDEVREALAENGRQMTALKDEVREALAENGRQMSALKDDMREALVGVHKTEAGIHETEADLHKAMGEVHKAINGQTWRYVAFTGTLLAGWAAVLLGLVRLLLPAS